MVDQEAMFDDQEAMLDDQEAMFDDQEAMCVLMHFMVQPSFDLGCDNNSSAGATRFINRIQRIRRDEAGFDYISAANSRSSFSRWFF